MYRKSFLSPLLQNEPSDFIDIFTREYVNGGNSSDTSGTNETERMKKKMKGLYQWTDKLPPSWLGAHKCSDLILYAGKNILSFIMLSYQNFLTATCCPKRDFYTPLTPQKWKQIFVLRALSQLLAHSLSF